MTPGQKIEALALLLAKQAKAGKDGQHGKVQRINKEMRDMLSQPTDQPTPVETSPD